MSIIENGILSSEMKAPDVETIVDYSGTSLIEYLLKTIRGHEDKVCMINLELGK